MFVVPSSLGLEYRILNGYVYLSGNSVTDEATIARRAELFERRGGYYYEHWGELDAQWREKVETEIHELEALEVPALPEVEEESLVREGRGWGSAHRLLVAYGRLLEALDRICHYHFELVNLGYGAYLVFYEVGVVEGVARVILDVDRLNDVEEGEILVTAFTSTSWTPVFGRIAAAVTDAGGVMCHAAIVAREYGLPAVLGTGSGTKLIAMGDLIRVDADNGIVTIVRRQ
jgi:phosphohistidine swiveling domain-containing protein